MLEMENRESRDRSGAAARLEDLDSAFRLVDEIGGEIVGYLAGAARQSIRHESVSTKPYGEEDRRENTRMDALERSLRAMAQSIQDLCITRDAAPPTAHGRHRHYSDRIQASRQDPEDFLLKEKMDMTGFEGI